MSNKIYSFLGIAQKANKIVSGDETCEKIIRNGKAKLVIISADASENTKDKFGSACNYRHIDIRFFGEKALLGSFLGKNIRSVIAVLDLGIAKRLIELIDDISLNTGVAGFDKNQSL